jgi:hypothetical protein
MKALPLLIVASLLSGTAGLVLADPANNVAGKPVRAQIAGSDRSVYDGKLVRQFGCWYVQFNKPTKDGFQSVRLDEVARLQLATKGAWTNASIAALRSSEPARCFGAGNG